MPTIPVLRGRGAELRAIGEALDAARDGQGSVVLVEAPAGFGKTRLLSEAAQAATTRGFAVGAATASSGDNLTPMAALVAALFGGGDPLLDPVVLRDLDLRPEARYWLLEEIEARLEQTSRAQPLVISLDDLQWADASTVAALQVLPWRLRASPVVWLLAARRGEAGPDTGEVIARLAREGAVRLPLRALDEAAVRLVIEDAVGVPSAELLALAERAGGCPFLLIELLVGQREEGRVTVAGGVARLVEDGLPRRITDSVGHRLRGLSPAAGAAARGGAVLDSTFSVGELVSLLGVAPVDLIEPVDELLRSDVLIERGDRLTFRHDLLRDGVLGTLEAGELGELRRRAAGVLLRGGSAPLQVAARLVAGAEPGDEEAIRALFAAAHAAAADQPGVAADLGLQALRLALPGAAIRGDLIAAIALWLHAAGRIEEGRALTDGALRETLSAADEGRVRLSIAGMFSLSPDERARVGLAALEIPDLPDELRASHLARLVHNLAVAGRAEEAGALVPQARAAAAGASAAVSFTLDLADVARDYAADRFVAAVHNVRRAKAGALASGEDARARLADQWLAEALAVADDFDGAFAVTREGLQAAQRDGRVWTVRAWEAWRGRMLLQSGQIADASAALEGAVGEELDTENLAEASAGFAMGRIALYLDDVTATQSAAALAERTYAVAWPELKRHAAWLLALQAEARGDAAGARDVLLADVGDRAAILPRLARDIADEVRVARIACAAGDERLARWAVDVTIRRAELNPGIHSITGIAAHTRGLVDRDATALAVAVAELERSPRRLALASALEDAGAMARDAGDRDAAIAAFGRALEISVSTGARAGERRLRERLRALGVRRRIVRDARPASGWAALTPSEAEVARLAAEGLTNRELADRLVVSPHTVSMHLRRAFEKLAIGSRRELPAHVPAPTKR